MMNVLTFMRRVLDSCDVRTLKRLGIEYLHEMFGNRNRIEGWFRELKDRTRRFYKNINSKTVKRLGEIAAIALIHNINIETRIEGDVLPG
ncbi:MAG: hypothetical protein QXR45_09210 [Candidatus Bathyarchaeia archaeon]